MNVDNNFELKNLLKKIFIEVNPNHLAFSYINNDIRLQNFTENDIENCINDLVKESFIEIDQRCKRIPTVQKSWKLTTSDKYPREDFILMGGIKIPRLLGDDGTRAEDINQNNILIGKFIHQINEELEKKYEQKTYQYWANQITILGIFISVFSFITISGNKLNNDFHCCLKGLGCFLENLFELVPLALVLFIFVALLKFIIERREK